VDDLIVSKTHTFSDITSSSVRIAIMVCEEDGWPDTEDDLADISSDTGGNFDEIADTITPTIRKGVYTTYYNLITESLTGDTTIFENGYYKTSGDYDGSTSFDQNDASVWFSISDNYDSPNAEAGSNHNIDTGEKVNFDGGQSSASSGSTITDYKWDVDGDGTWDYQTQIASYTYTTKGTYTVTLQVTDSLGETDTDTCTVYISNQDPVAAFAYSPNNYPHPTTLDTVQFTDTSTDEDGTLASWYWNFGDGTTSTERNPTHKFSSGKTFSVSLKVTDNDGGYDTETKSITVIALATITGTVKDKDGNPISSAKIKLYDAGKTTVLETATTNSNGVYTISEIATDTYDIESSKSGYDNNKKTSKTIKSGDNTVDFVLTATAPVPNGRRTPGFEVIFAFLAMVIVSIILLSKKNE
jgi:PKD repeat protein